MNRTRRDETPMWQLLIDPTFLILCFILGGTVGAAIPIPREQERPRPIIQVEGRKVEEAVPLRAQEIEELKRRLRALEDESRRLEAASHGAAREAKERVEAATVARRARAQQVAELSGVLQQKEEEVAELEEALRRMANNREVGGMGTPVLGHTNKKPVLVEVVRGRVVVVDKPQYEFRSARTPSGERLTVAKRKTQGEDLDELERPGSAFSNALNKLDREKEYLTAIVHSDSFPAFRAVRELARKRQVEFGWLPFMGEDGELIFSDNGQKAGVQS
jgi:hypothetical protein